MKHEDMIFVFGSNLAGRHGKGAALFAKQNKGAIYGQAIGLQGDAYAIPTKDFTIKCALPIVLIEKYVKEFLIFAEQNQFFDFYVSPIGCGLAGYTPEEIAPLFKGHPDNVFLNEQFQNVLSTEEER